MSHDVTSGTTRSRIFPPTSREGITTSEGCQTTISFGRCRNSHFPRGSEYGISNRVGHIFKRKMGFFILCHICTTTEGRATFKTIIKGVILMIILHFIIKFEQVKEHGDYLSLAIPDDETTSSLFVSKQEEFPKFGRDKIPKIIHQTWKTTSIPVVFIPWVSSWFLNNPDWEYWLWTDESSRQFLADRYPNFLSVFDKYLQPIRRADAIRYFILYEFGGVYADLDMENIKSLNPIIKKYDCFLGREPLVHSILDSNFEDLVINALMGCRKGHPFMKMLIDYLPKFFHMWFVLDSTGPHFVTYVFQEYKAKYSYPTNSENGTYLTPPEYFYPSIDPVKHFNFHTTCSNYDRLSTIQKSACVHLKKTSLLPSDLSLSFTIHHWIHTYASLISLNFKGPTDIRNLNANVKIYQSD